MDEFDAHFADVEAHFADFRAAAMDRLGPPLDLAASPDGTRLAFTSTVRCSDAPGPGSVVALLDLSGDAAAAPLRNSGNNDRRPRFSPNGDRLALLSDPLATGIPQLVILDFASGRYTDAPRLDAVIEDYAWSADGQEILVQTAGRGADMAGTQGSGTLKAGTTARPAWLPQVEDAVPTHMWRRLRRWKLGAEAMTDASPSGLNIWEADWCGGGIVAVVSDNPREGAWYTARLDLIGPDGAIRTLYRPGTEQIGWPAASPDGGHVAFVEACCSDRQLVAGELLLVDTASGALTRLDTEGVEVTRAHWRSATQLFYVGIRGFESVAAEIDVATGARRILWTTREHFGPKYPDAALLPGDRFAIVHQGYRSYPRILVVAEGEARAIQDFAHPGSDAVLEIAGEFEEVTWQARDGIEIQGYLATPPGPGPHPLMVLVHGGPVFAFRNAWSMGYIFTPLLVGKGYAVLHPNPRGSAGRGQPFARAVRGDMGGEDTHDILRGVEMLIEKGVTRRGRIAVMGRSYGGFMSSWLVTQTDLFSAAVPMAPTTDWLSMHFTSNIPDFDAIFLDDDLHNLAGRYYSRSPVMFAESVRTPTLNIAGGLDRCTPPTQALEFHRALVENGVASECVIYPEEGHHVLRHESQVDLCTRILAWLDRHLEKGPDHAL